MVSTRGITALLFPTLIAVLTSPAHSTVHMDLFTRRYEGATIADSFRLSRLCGEDTGCSLMHCAALCTSNPGCKSFSFRDSDTLCVHYSVLATDPAVTPSLNYGTGWVTYEKEAEAQPRDCTDVAASADGVLGGGVYTIYPTTTPVQAYCSVNRGSMWTVIDKREDGSVSFQKPLADFVTGFGTPDNSHWIGLDVIHTMTSSAQYELLVLAVTSSDTYDALYSNFSVDGPPDYSLRYNQFLGGTAGDALVNFKDQHFEGRGSLCSDCLGWWVEYVNSCCSDTPHHHMPGESLWSSDYDDFYLIQFRMMIRRV